MKDLYIKSCRVEEAWALVFPKGASIVMATPSETYLPNFIEGVGTDVGAIEISMDDISYSPITFPLQITSTFYYFRRADTTKNGIYELTE